jgi:hypothetical protein
MYLELIQSVTNAPASLPPVIANNDGFWKQLLCVCTAGAFGGAVFAAAMLLEGGKKDSQWTGTKGVGLSSYVFGQTVVGVGGAMSAVFAVLTVGKTVGAIDPSNLLGSYLYTASLSLVAGFIGNKLLPGVGLSLAKQLTQVETKIQDTAIKAAQASAEVKSVAKDVTKVADNVAKTTDAMLDIIKARDEVASLNVKRAQGKPVDTARAQEFISKLKEYSKGLPTNRVLHIVLGNLFYEVGDTNNAVAVLEGFIKNREDAGQANDDDTATAWFNISCFWSLSIEQVSNEEDKKKLEDKAIKALENCLTVAKASGPNTLEIHVRKAKTDPDLEPLRKRSAVDPILKNFI